MKNKKITRVTSGIAVLVLAVVLLFTLTASAVTPTIEAGIRQLSYVDTQYEQFLNSSVMYRLPDGVDDDQEISIIVMLDNPSLLDTYDSSSEMSFGEYTLTAEADALRAEISAEKSKLLEELDELDVVYSTGAEYANVLSGFEVIIKAKYYDELCSSLGDNATAIIGEEYKPAETQLVENEVSVYEGTGIFDSSNFKYKGEGMVVAVLDTGLDYTHSAFATPDDYDLTKLGLTYSEVASTIGDTKAAQIISGLTADDVYISPKIPFAFDYADSDSDVYSIHNTHGTHVSGVIVGKDDTITGVAPEAQLVSMKIFSDILDSARTSWILSGLEDCVALGVDVINMSLGTACGFSTQSDKELINGNVYEKIRNKGISLVVAASNSYSSTFGSEKNGNLGLTSNPDTGTVGSPSTYEAALSVASISGTKTPYLLYNSRIMYFVEASDSASEEKNFVNELLDPLGVNEAEFEYVTIPGVGRPTDYSGIDVVGKIALVKRGTNTFEEKANAAKEAGARGVIVYNNTSGDIKMSVGDTVIAICSVSRDDGETLAAAGSGTIKISRSQMSGPFMSDFSSWGPTPDLRIKPEITAHGGNILSAVTGGDYDRLSGTSMASPNMAGVVTLLRQYVIENFADKDIKTGGQYDYVKINAIVNRLAMSTADTIYNKNGLPYSVRKQGAGLANLNSSAATPAYILTYSLDDGSVMDKTKIELGDDPARSGVYTLKFSVYNFGNTSLSYDISATVMTEGVSDVTTYHNLTTVSETGYILDGASIYVECTANGTLNGNSLTVEPGMTADVTLTITLSEEDKKYLDDSFENGMYVEGFVNLTATSGTEINLSSPFLAFYGDWTEAALFDIDYFETNADELNDSIALLDKTLPDAYATRPIGGVSLDYINYLGAYYFIQNPSDQIIGANREYISLSNVEGSVHSLRYVWAGLLRNAEKVVTTITDDATGEVIFSSTDTDIRKSYGDGSTIRPAVVEIEFDAAEYNLKNNTTYTVKLQGYLDYGDGGVETNKSSTFEFPLTADFEAPAVTDVVFRTEYDRNAKKNRLYADIYVYDNHYAMAMQVGYIAENPDFDSSLEIDSDNNPSIFKNFSSYLTPIYSERDSTTVTTYDLTDYIYEIAENSVRLSGNSVSGLQYDNNMSIAIACYDYAMNYAVYEIPLPGAFEDFYIDESDFTEQEDGSKILLLNPNEVYTIKALAYPSTEWSEILKYESEDESVADIINGKIIARSSGTTTINVYDASKPNNAISFTVKVRAEGDEGYNGRITQQATDSFTVFGYKTIRAYYAMSSDERDIGQTNESHVFGSAKSLKLYPWEQVLLNYTSSDNFYFPENTQILFESTNEKVVTVDSNGYVTGVAEGKASITVRLLLNGKSTAFSETIQVEVKDPYVRTGPWLTHYFGLGGVVSIPEDLKFTEISQFAFTNYHYIEKGPEDEISEDFPETTKIYYRADNNSITKVIIPEGVEKIGPYAFAGMTNLVEVELPSTLKYIEYGAFYGCSSLTTVKGLENVCTINKYAFSGCDLTGTLSLNNIYAIADEAFRGNKNILEVNIASTISSIGSYAFYGNTSLIKVTVDADKVKLGNYVFANCTTLSDISINSSVIPAGAFENCKSLKSFTIGKDVNVIGEYAFAGSGITELTLASGNTTFTAATTQSGIEYLTTNNGTVLALVSPAASGAFVLNDTNITTIGTSAFSGNSKITSVTMNTVTAVKENAFAECYILKAVGLGQLTEIGDYSFYKTALTLLPDLSGLTKIGSYAFAFTKVRRVSIPDGMTVGEGAFTECTLLESVTIGNDVTIGFAAFKLDDELYTNREIITPSENIYGRYYYLAYKSLLYSLTIGDNVTIGDSAFYGAGNLHSVQLGKGASIGSFAFYNASALTTIDLSEAKSIGDYAFSGLISYMYTGYNAASGELYDIATYTNSSGELVPMYFILAAKMTSADLTSLEHIGSGAFQYCVSLASVTVGESLKSISDYTFGQCLALASINLANVESIGEAAFALTALTSVDLSNVKTLGNYALAQCYSLTEVTLNPNGMTVGEGAFADDYYLAAATNLNKVTEFGSYSFANTNITDIDLTDAIKVDDYAFFKDENLVTANPNATHNITLTLGKNIQTLGDNPFAMCVIAPIYEEKEPYEFNGTVYPQEPNYTFDINDYVKIIDGSIYCKVPNGLELITYISPDHTNVVIPEGTVRITGYAFANSGVKRVTLPHSLFSIGHKAFWGCDDLHTVIFKSYDAPNLEEEFDKSLITTGDFIPATGEYTFINSITGTTFSKHGLGIVPFYMYDCLYSIDSETGEDNSNYSNIYYGANFVDYIGLAEGNIIMVRPSNGRYYESFIYGQYFDLEMLIDGSVAADHITSAAIEAINRIPADVEIEHEDIVAAAREAYNKVVTNEQKALVYNYKVLADAENLIKALKSELENNTQKPDESEPETFDPTPIIVAVCIVAALLICGGAVFFLIKKKKHTDIPTPTPEEPECAVPCEADEDESAETEAVTDESEPACDNTADAECTVAADDTDEGESLCEDAAEASQTAACDTAEETEQESADE